MYKTEVQWEKKFSTFSAMATSCWCAFTEVHWSCFVQTGCADVFIRESLSRKGLFVYLWFVRPFPVLAFSQSQSCLITNHSKQFSRFSNYLSSQLAMVHDNPKGIHRVTGSVCRTVSRGLVPGGLQEGVSISRELCSDWLKYWISIYICSLNGFSKLLKRKYGWKQLDAGVENALPVKGDAGPDEMANNGLCMCAQCHFSV